jgi:hypothetical protein
MSIIVDCQQCGKRIAIAEGASGDTIICPQCNGDVSVTAATFSLPEGLTGAAARRRPRSRRWPQVAILICLGLVFVVGGVVLAVALSGSSGEPDSRAAGKPGEMAKADATRKGPAPTAGGRSSDRVPAPKVAASLPTPHDTGKGRDSKPPESSSVDVVAVSFSLDEFEKVHKQIRPQPGESRWTEIPWLTSLPEARKRAASEGKLLLVWRAGGGDPIGFA